MTPKLISGCNAGLDFGSSDVALNDTLIEANEALYAPAIFVGQDSTVMMNRCTIAGNRALRVLNNGIHIDGDMAGISIGTGSKVTMNDVSIRNNLAEGECAAISNSEILSLKNVRIYENIADNYSAILNSREGEVTLGNNIQIFDNNAIEDVHSEGILNRDFN